MCWQHCCASHIGPAHVVGFTAEVCWLLKQAQAEGWHCAPHSNAILDTAAVLLCLRRSKKQPTAHRPSSSHGKAQRMTSRHTRCMCTATGHSSQVCTTPQDSCHCTSSGPCTGHCADRSCLALPAGEQATREYDWTKANVDPASHRFGLVDTKGQQSSVKQVRGMHG